MNGSKQRIQRVLRHQTPDRPPLFDLIPNDDILEHFNGGVPVDAGDDAAAIRALCAATDSTRFTLFSPMAPRTESIEHDRQRTYERWTFWTSHRAFSSSEEYRDVKMRELDVFAKRLEQPVRREDSPQYERDRSCSMLFDDDYYYVFGAPSTCLMGIYTEVGLEAFSYYLFDCEDVIVRQLELNTQFACRWAESLSPEDPFETVFLGEDIAFKTGPMVSPVWLKQHYFPRIARVVAALHAAGKHVMFHSDGNLNPVMDDLVETEIDALNPVEIGAGMDLADLHRRYPDLIYAGGIDASDLLPHGTKQQIASAVHRAIDETEGQILIGSSTEVFNIVPLDNYLALREAAIQYRF